MSYFWLWQFEFKGYGWPVLPRSGSICHDGKGTNIGKVGQIPKQISSRVGQAENNGTVMNFYQGFPLQPHQEYPASKNERKIIEHDVCV